MCRLGKVQSFVNMSLLLIFARDGTELTIVFRFSFMQLTVLLQLLVSTIFFI